VLPVGGRRLSRAPTAVQLIGAHGARAARLDRFGLTNLNRCSCSIITLAQAALGIWSLASMISAYQALEANAGDVSNSLDNWLLPPIVDVQFLTSPSSQFTSAVGCPSSHPLLLNSLTYPGVSSGLCACRDGARWVDGGEVYPQSSSVSACDTNQTRAGCVDDSAIGNIGMPLWNSRAYICAARGGEGAVISRNPYKARPQPGAGKPCPTGYTRCGSPTDDNKAICFPSSVGVCPVTQLLSMPSSSYSPSSYPNSPNGTIGGQTYVASRNPDNLPVVQYTAGFKSVCVGTVEAYQYNKAVATLSGTSYISSSCQGGRTTDDRYVGFATATQQTILNENFDSNQAYCDTTGRTTRAVSGFTGTCGTGDNICSTVTTRSRCSKLLSYDTGSGTSDDLTLFYRREIQWAYNCPVTRQSLVENVDPLLSIVQFSFTVTVINAISNVVGIIIYINLIINLVYGDSPCCPFSHEKEKTLLRVGKTYVDTGAKLIRFAPLLSLTMQVSQVNSFWTQFESSSCTDSTTTQTLQLIRKVVEGALRSNSITLAVDAVSLIFSLYNVVKAIFCPKADVNADDEEGDEKPGVVPAATSNPAASYPAAPSGGAPVAYPAGGAPAPSYPAAEIASRSAAYPPAESSGY
jgi:hypothetical protein